MESILNLLPSKVLFKRKSLMFLFAFLFSIHANSSYAGSIDKSYMVAMAKKLSGVEPFQYQGQDYWVTDRGLWQSREKLSSVMKEKFLELGYSIVKKDVGVESNVIASHPSHTSEKFIVLSAHFDTVFYDHFPGNVPGANDNAAGLAIAFAVAEALSSKDPGIRVRIALFDYEEYGRDGSKSYIKEADLTHFIGNFNLDMIGYSSNNTDIFLDTCFTEDDVIYNGQRIYLSEKFKGSATRNSISFKYNEICRGNSDHESFWDKGYPAFRLASTRRASSDRCYHSKCDTFNRLNLDYMEKVANALLKTFLEF